MTRDEYNAKVQYWQETCGDNSRIRPVVGKDGTIHYAEFDVHWDGRWHNLGKQHNPMTPNARYEWNEHEELRISARAADALVRS